MRSPPDGDGNLKDSGLAAGEVAVGTKEWIRFRV